MKMHTCTLQPGLLLLVGLALLASCADGSGRSDYDGLQFDSLCIDCKEHLYGDTAMPAATLMARFAYVKEATTEGLADAINAQIIDLCIGADYHNMPIADALDAYVNDLMTSYHDDVEPLFKEFQAEDGTNSLGDDDNFLRETCSFQYDVRGHVALYRGNLLTYRYDGREYTGGAHGSYFTYYTNIDLRTLQPITLESLMKDDTTDLLTDLLWNQLMLQTGTKSREEAEEMGYCCLGELTPVENFCLGPEGITFHYNVYEITPYVMGDVDITVPWPMLGHLLKDDADIVDSVR